MRKQALILILFFLVLQQPLVSQPQVFENQLSKSFSQRAIHISNYAANDHLHLYNGIEYINYDDGIEGYQFFESEVLEEATLMYDGILYENVPMLYDIVKDEVVIEHFHNYFKIRLIPEKISTFSLLNHSFVRIEADSLSDSGLTRGFYEILYDGKVKVLAKRIKIMEEEIVDQRLKRRFVQKDRYYIYKKTLYSQVKGQQAIMRVFKDRKKEIRKFIKANKLKFTTNPETAFTSISRFYDNLLQE